MTRKIKTLLIFFIIAISLPLFPLKAEETLILSRNLKYGDSGEDVRQLQIFLNNNPITTVAKEGYGSKGNETTYFGGATRAAVVRFQEKYVLDVLLPIGLKKGTGYVGSFTIAKINSLISSLAQAKIQIPLSLNKSTSAVSGGITSPTPKVFSVSPERVRQGDTVTIYGEGFTQTGNTVLLRYALIEDKFSNLSSPDGKTITFTFIPPEVRTMTKDEILALPADIQNQIMEPIQKAGGSIDDIVAPYRNIKNEEELKGILEKTGHFPDGMYDYFYVTVENSGGRGSTNTAVLQGLRKIAFGTSLSANNNLFSKFSDLFDSLIPKVSAQGIPGGGYNSGIIMLCTCSGGFLTFMLDSAGGGSGLYYFYPGFVPVAGTGFIAAPWLGFYTPSAGTCINFPPYCAVDITANIPVTPWGAGL